MTSSTTGGSATDPPESLNVAVGLNVGTTLHARLAAEASRSRRSKSSVVRLALEEYLDRQDRRNEPGATTPVRRSPHSAA